MRQDVKSKEFDVLKTRISNVSSCAVYDFSVFAKLKEVEKSRPSPYLELIDMAIYQLRGYI